MRSKSPTAESALAVSMLGYRILAALVSKGLLEPYEAASAATEAAEDVRRSTEGDANQGDGEMAARQLEMIAGWVLKCRKAKEA